MRGFPVSILFFKEEIIMPFSGEFKYNKDPDFDYLISESGTNFIALRKIKFGKAQDDECKPEDRKLDLRKWSIDQDGNERMLKGIQFHDNDSVDELTNTLVELGYGDTKHVLTCLKEREEFAKIIPFVFTDKDIIEGDDGEYYDPRKVLNPDV